jgi:hypothetical protein
VWVRQLLRKVWRIGPGCLGLELTNGARRVTGQVSIWLAKQTPRQLCMPIHTFLAPREHLEAEVGRGRSAISYPELRRLKHFYGMSAAAMLIRVRDLGLVPEASVEYAFRTYAQAWRTKEPDPIRAHEGLGAFERPIRFEQLVYRALSEELIAPARAALLLKRPLSAIERDMRGPKAS